MLIKKSRLHINQNEAGNYRIRVYNGTTPEGKPKFVTTTYKVSDEDKKLSQAKIEAKVNAFAEDFLRRVDRGTVEFRDKTFSSVSSEWMKTIEESNSYSETSIQRYKQLKEVIESTFGDMKIADIRQKDIQEFISTVKNKNTGEAVSSKTQSLYKGYISKVFQHAVVNEYLEKSPCVGIKISRRESSERDVFTVEEAKRFLNLLDGEDVPLKYKVFFNLVIHTGLRPGEMLGLEWNDINWDNKTLHVQRTCYDVPGKGMVCGKPKTKKSNRFLPLNDYLLDLLREQEAFQKDLRIKNGDRWVETGKIFTSDCGKPMGSNTARHWVENFLERNGMDKKDVHSMRHFFTSCLINESTNVSSVSTLLGHSNTTTTLNIYAHEFAEKNVEAVSGVSDILGK